MFHFTMRDRIRDILALLHITIINSRTNSMISTAIIHHSKYIIYHDSKIEAKAPTKKVNLRKSGTLPRYSIILIYSIITERPTTAPAPAPETK